jgi:PAS domain S-box-containing protein
MCSLGDGHLVFRRITEVSTFCVTESRFAGLFADRRQCSLPGQQSMIDLQYLGRSMLGCAEDNGIPFCRQSDAFCAAFEHLGVAAAQVSLAGRWLMVNQRFCDLVGFSRPEITGNLFYDFFVDGGSDDPHMQQLIAGETSTHQSERIARLKDGRTITLKTVFSVFRDQVSNVPTCLLVLFEDISGQRKAEDSQRDLADRLIQAQEAERTRIARELHDDIGQELAILCVQMQRSGKPVSGMPGKRHPDLDALCEKVRGIADKVSRISHELHSSKLEYLGLKVAVQSACREFADGSRIEVECTCEHVPTKVDETVGLCFLRVVQEALHNIGKHSGAKRVEVQLSAVGNSLKLVIADDGVGFDVDSAQLADGLGLMSMRERLHLIGGQFEITSQIGKGTTIKASAPVMPSEKRPVSRASNLR